MQLENMQIQGLIIDMDGVLWRGDEPIGDLPEIFRNLQRKHLKVVLATNNATRSVYQYHAKLRGFGVEIEDWQIINSPVATALYLKKLHHSGGPLYIIGESGLVTTLQEYGFFHTEKEVLAVVVGMDRTLTYAKLAKATLLIRSGAPFIGTNPDRTFPLPEGLVPGAGAILAAIETAADTHPVIIGKPAPEMYQAALDRMGLEADHTLVVGDRLETDIAGAQRLGCRTALVLSGVTGQAEAELWKPTPDWIGLDLTQLVRRLNAST